MDAFEALRVEEAGAVAEEHPAVAGEPRHGEPAAVGEALGAVADHFAALEDAAGEGVALEALEDVVGVGAGVLVVEAGDVADGDFGVGDAVDPCAAVFVRGQGVAEGVNDFTLGDAARRNFPKLFDAEAVGLGVVRVFEIEALDELFGAVAPCALREDGDFGAEVVAGLEVGLGLTLLVDSLVVGANSGDVVFLPVSLVEEQFGGGESGEEGDSGLLDLGGEPLHEFVDGDDVVAVVAQRRRHDGEFVLARPGEEIDGLLGDLGVDGGLGLEAGEELAHGAGVQ